MQPKRVIMRVDVGPRTPKALERIVEQFGSTNISVNSRVVEWLVAQESTVQAVVLGIYPLKKVEPKLVQLLGDEALFAYPFHASY
jgi:hypothetical protein